MDVMIGSPRRETGKMDRRNESSERHFELFNSMLYMLLGLTLMLSSKWIVR
jgi:hypothetical protein